MIISSDSVYKVSFTTATLYLVTFVKFQYCVAKSWLLEVRVTLKILFSCPPLMTFASKVLGKRFALFVSLADLYDIWHVESWDLKLCHGIGQPAGESREFSHNIFFFSRVIRCAERHLKMGEIHCRNDIYLEKRTLLFKEEYGEKL